MSVTYDEPGLTYDQLGLVYDTLADTWELWRSCGPIARWDAENGYPLLTWLSGPGTILQVLDDLIRDTDTDPGWSVLLDVDRCPTYALPWLAQFVGVRLDPAAADTAQRAEIRTQPRFARGTIDALRAIAQSYLQGTKAVVIAERDTSPYHLTLTVYAAELEGLHYNDLTATYSTYNALTGAFPTYNAYAAAIAELIAELQAAKPAGLQMTVTIAAGNP